MDAEEWREERERAQTEAETLAGAKPPAAAEESSREAVRADVLDRIDAEELARIRRLPPVVAEARYYGLIAIACELQAGADDAEIARMRGRMNAWVRYLIRWQRERKQVVENLGLPPRDRRLVVRDMERGRDQERAQIFGLEGSQ